MELPLYVGRPKAMRVLLALAGALMLVTACTGGAREVAPSSPPESTSGATPSVKRVRELPPPTREDFRSEVVSNKAGFRFWPISGAAELGVVYRFDVPHCGLQWLTDFDGSFWRPLDADLLRAGARAVLINADRGTIELVTIDTAEYVSSTDAVVTLARLQGPVVRQPCD